MLAIDFCVARVEAVLEKTSQRVLATKAGLQSSILRGVGTPGWNPTRRTLAALEAACEQLANDDAPVPRCRHADQRAPKTRRGQGAAP